MPIRLEIVTPEKLAYRDDVDMVILPGSEGVLGILPRHAPLISTLGMGELRIKKGDQEEVYAVIGGFVQVRPDRVVVMAETADLASDIDLEKANEARLDAERALEIGLVEEADLASARAALQAALVRMRIAERRQHRERPHHEGTRRRP
jgi:F-type H+-transporting ATPase subunit epsilon